MMKTLVRVAAATALFASVAGAQVPQNLGAADPSQQLKTTGMNTFQSQNAFTTRRDEKKDPLVTNATPEEGAQAPAAAAPAAPATAPAVTPVVTPVVTPAPAYTAAPAVEQVPAPAPAAAATETSKAWNPAVAAPAAAPTAAAGAAQSEHMQHILDLVDQIKRRRDGR